MQPEWTAQEISQFSMTELTEQARKALKARDYAQASTLYREALRRAPFRQDLREGLAEALEGTMLTPPDRRPAPPPPPPPPRREAPQPQPPRPPQRQPAPPAPRPRPRREPPPPRFFDQTDEVDPPDEGYDAGYDEEMTPPPLPPRERRPAAPNPSRRRPPEPADFTPELEFPPEEDYTAEADDYSPEADDYPPDRDGRRPRPAARGNGAPHHAPPPRSTPPPRPAPPRYAPQPAPPPERRPPGHPRPGAQSSPYRPPAPAPRTLGQTGRAKPGAYNRRHKRGPLLAVFLCALMGAALVGAGLGGWAYLQQRKASQDPEAVERARLDTVLEQAVVFSGRGEDSKAIDLLRQQAASRTRDEALGRIFNDQGDRLFRQQPPNYEGAVEAYKNAVQANPANPEYGLRLGETYYLLGDARKDNRQQSEHCLDLARDAFAAVLRHNPASLDALKWQSKVALARHDDLLFAKTQQQIVEAAPDSPEATTARRALLQRNLKPIGK